MHLKLIKIKSYVSIRKLISLFFVVTILLIGCSRSTNESISTNNTISGYIKVAATSEVGSLSLHLNQSPSFTLSFSSL
tara:strand:- start:493 stop:726 length:234 start_codon:yes stop_codon:yes gene_type:complete